MSATPSTMLPLKTTMPAFRLPNTVNGAVLDSQTVNGRGVLVMFICNHCPYVVHIRSELVKVAHEALAAGVQVVAINSNSERTHPQDGPAQMKQLAHEEQWRFAFCFDETQEVARAFHAACTPDFFLFDGEKKLVYRGQFDASRPGNEKPVTGADLRAAIAEVAAGRVPSADQKSSIGCNIKWHPS